MEKRCCSGNHPRPRTTQRLVRRRRDHVAMLEGRGVLLRGNEARDVSDVRHEDGANLIRDGAEPRKIDGARLGRGTTEKHGRAEDQRLFPQLFVFDDACLGVNTVWERLEVDGCGGDLLLGCVVTVGQVPTTWQAEAHDARVSCQQSRVHGKVRWAARVRLVVHTPLNSLVLPGDSEVRQSVRRGPFEHCVPIDRQSLTPAPSANAAENCEIIIVAKRRAVRPAQRLKAPSTHLLPPRQPAPRHTWRPW